MDFLVVGPGAMGCLFAARLKKADHHVTLLDYRQERADHINEHGIRVEGITGEYRIRVPTITKRDSRTPDVVLICVKANQTQEAAQGLKPWLGNKALVLTLQNGLGNLEILQKIFGEDMVLGGVTAQGATLLGHGHIRHAGQGQTVIGPEKASGGVVGEIVSAFNDSGFETSAVRNVNDPIWGKLVINVGINALTAILRLKNGRLADVDGAKTVMEKAVREATAVADAKGVTLPYPDPLERVLGVCRATSGNISSMLQDVLNHRITEVGFINGAVVREATALGIPTPVNLALTNLVLAIQDTYHERMDVK